MVTNTIPLGPTTAEVLREITSGPSRPEPEMAWQRENNARAGREHMRLEARRRAETVIGVPVRIHDGPLRDRRRLFEWPRDSF